MADISDHSPLEGYETISNTEMEKRVTDFYTMMKKRRTVRHFSDKPVPDGVIASAIKTAGTAPSGANKQPWHFVAISAAGLKSKIRHAAEEEERAFYGGKAGDSWLKDLEQFGTDANKPFLETAPWLIVIFKETYELKDGDEKHKNYYVNESVGIATGFLIAALHNAGLATLTHTPSPMGFLREIFGRPVNEKAVMLLVAGHPAEDAVVPKITKKSLQDISTWCVGD